MWTLQSMIEDISKFFLYVSHKIAFISVSFVCHVRFYYGILLRALRELHWGSDEAKNVLLKLIPMRTKNYQTDHQTLKLKLGQAFKGFRVSSLDHVTTCFPLRKMHVPPFPHPIRNTYHFSSSCSLESKALPTQFHVPHFPHHFPLFQPWIPSLPTLLQSFTSFFQDSNVDMKLIEEKFQEF